MNEVTQLLATPFNGDSCAIFLTKNGLGYILGDIFAKLSGHPGCVP
jgi:hypothetical protein